MAKSSHLQCFVFHDVCGYDDSEKVFGGHLIIEYLDVVMVCDMRHMCRRSHTCSGSGFISEDLRSLHFHSHIMVDVDESITPAFTICLLVFSIYLGGASSKRGR